MHRVELSRRAVKDLAGLDRTMQLRVLRKLDGAAKDPPRFFLPLKGVHGFRMRVGDLRVIADILQKDQVILVAMIGRRESVYD